MHDILISTDHMPIFSRNSNEVYKYMSFPSLGSDFNVVWID